MRSFFLRGDIFSLSFQLFQFDNYSMEESGHCREVERRVNVCHVWTVRPKKNNNKDGPCREVTVKEEVDISSEVRLNITWYYGTTIFSGIWWAQNCNKLYGYQTQLYWLKSMRQYYWVLKAIVFAATDMPFFENCRTVASYIFAWTLPAEFSFQRHF